MCRSDGYAEGSLGPVARCTLIGFGDRAGTKGTTRSAQAMNEAATKIRSRAGRPQAYEGLMTETALTVRTLQAADDVAEVVHHAFLADATPASRERELSMFEPGRYHGVFDSETMIGVAGMLTRDLTVPGLVPVPVAAVTTVGVLPDHRRRGALSMLMRTQLHELHESRGEPIAALWASEGETCCSTTPPCVAAPASCGMRCTRAGTRSSGSRRTGRPAGRGMR